MKKVKKNKKLPLPPGVLSQYAREVGVFSLGVWRMPIEKPIDKKVKK
jgi:hypothetical protein